MFYDNLAERTGDSIYDFLENFGRLCQFTWLVIKDVLAGKIRWKLTLEQMQKVGNDSLPLALITAAFIGMVFALQIAGEFARFGAGKFVGGVMSVGLARELGPAVTGIVVAARIAAAIAAELGTMKVKEQIDALSALGTNPINYLVVPRFVAAAVMLPVLTILAIIVGFFGGFLVAIGIGSINPLEYMEMAQQFLSLWDVFGGVSKTILFGMIIAIIASYKGLTTKGGAKGVGEATTSAVVRSLISLFIVNYFLSILFFR